MFYTLEGTGHLCVEPLGHEGTEVDIAYEHLDLLFIDADRLKHAGGTGWGGWGGGRWRGWGGGGGALFTLFLAAGTAYDGIACRVYTLFVTDERDKPKNVVYTEV
jgi:hypothetical protein